MALFQASVLKSHLALLNEASVDRAYKKYQNYFWNITIQENIKTANEEQFQATFLNQLFVNIFGYTLFPNPDSNLTTEFKNEKNNRKADGAILNNGLAVGVIELKGTNTKDLESIRRQAFDYKANHKGCVYVITSNFEKLRFYINDATEFEEFDLFTLAPERFKLLYLCLHKDSVFNNTPLKIKEASVVKEEEITKAFYKDYSLFKRELYRDLVKRNAKTVKVKLIETNLLENQEYILRLEKNVKLTLFQKSQKLIDRFLFIFFAEDRMLLPFNSTIQILDKWKADWDFGDERSLYNLFKQYFTFLDTGRKGTQSRAEIYAYNGGLFKPDAILDALEIDSDLLYKYTKSLSNYDFESQVDVNILGHIFENSLNEIESVNAEIEGGEFDKQTSKRKKDGVFYTPKYITKYIVENTVGKLCAEKKAELDFHEEEYFKGRKNRNKSTIEKLVNTLDLYRDWLLQITICDPACGSGAFLNQALDFLIKEHAYIDELKAKVLGGGLQFPDIESTILENNIYGVDLNEESVEIAKLSLWLRTAQPRRKLNDLSSNIKCGNSLIDDKKVAGDKAFKWEAEFPNIFKQKEKKAFHITSAIHDSRTSSRMIKYKVREKRAMGTNPYPNVIYFTEAHDLVITQTIAEIVQEDNLRVLAYNICADHIHLLVVCDEADVPKIMQKVKGRSSRMVSIKGLKSLDSPSSEEHYAEGKPLWAQKYYCKPVTTEAHLHAAINYIAHNRSKHELPEHSISLNNLIDGMTCSYKAAFKEETKGGFDVVIGNPPYVRHELFTEIKPFLESKYKVFHGQADLYVYFFEKGISILKENGLFSIIVANKWLKVSYAEELRNWLRDVQVNELIDFGDLPVFSDASAYPCIVTLKNSEIKKDIEVTIVENLDFPSLIDYISLNKFYVDQIDLTKDSWKLIDKKQARILKKLNKSEFTLHSYTKGVIRRGIVTGLNEAFVIDKKIKDQLIEEHQSSREIIKPFLAGRNINKYSIQFENTYLIFTRRGIEIDNYPAVKSYLEKFRKRLEPKPKGWKGNWIGRKTGTYKWYEIQDSIDYFKEFEKGKIIYPNICNQPSFCIDNEGLYTNQKCFIIPIKDNSLLGVMNSKVFSFLFEMNLPKLRGGYYEPSYIHMKNFPIPKMKADIDIKIDELVSKVSSINIFLNKELKKQQTYIYHRYSISKLPRKLENSYELSFGDFIKELNKAIKSTNKERAKENLQAIPELSKKDEFEWMELFEENKKKAQELQTQIATTEKEIDQMVYELYGLTDEEIAIVESS